MRILLYLWLVQRYTFALAIGFCGFAGVLLVAVCASARLYAIGGSLRSAGCYLYIFVRIVSDAEAFIHWLCG